MEDVQEFLAAAKARLDGLTGVTPALKVGDRVRYRDTPVTQHLGCVGVYVGVITEIMNGGASIRTAHEKRGAFREQYDVLEVIPWVLHDGKVFPFTNAGYETVVEVKHRNEYLEIRTVGSCMFGDWVYASNPTDASDIIAYRVLKGE